MKTEYDIKWLNFEEIFTIEYVKGGLILDGMFTLVTSSKMCKITVPLKFDFANFLRIRP